MILWSRSGDRKPKTPKEERFCPLCINKVENEIHFLINCQAYNDLREKVWGDCMQLKPDFCYYTDTEKFIVLLTNEEISFEVSKLICLAMEKWKSQNLTWGGIQKRT